MADFEREEARECGSARYASTCPKNESHHERYTVSGRCCSCQNGNGAAAYSLRRRKKYTGEVRPRNAAPKFPTYALEGYQVSTTSREHSRHCTALLRQIDGLRPDIDGRLPAPRTPRAALAARLALECA